MSFLIFFNVNALANTDNRQEKIILWPVISKGLQMLTVSMISEVLVELAVDMGMNYNSNAIDSVDKFISSREEADLINSFGMAENGDIAISGSLIDVFLDSLNNEINIDDENRIMYKFTHQEFKDFWEGFTMTTDKSYTNVYYSTWNAANQYYVNNTGFRVNEVLTLFQSSYNSYLYLEINNKKIGYKLMPDDDGYYHFGFDNPNDFGTYKEGNKPSGYTNSSSGDYIFSPVNSARLPPNEWHNYQNNNDGKQGVLKPDGSVESNDKPVPIPPGDVPVPPPDDKPVLPEFPSFPSDGSMIEKIGFIFEVLWYLISFPIQFIFNALSSLVGYISAGLTTFGEVTSQMAAVFSFIPQDILNILFGGLALFIFLGAIKMFFGRN